jgi:hypothetical protein
MNIVAIAEFYLKHHDDIDKMVAKAKAMVPAGGTTDATLVGDLIGIVNKHAPGWNPNSTIEDALALFESAPAAAPPVVRDLGAAN